MNNRKAYDSLKEGSKTDGKGRPTFLETKRSTSITSKLKGLFAKPFANSGVHHHSSTSNSDSNGTDSLASSHYTTQRLLPSTYPTRPQPSTTQQLHQNSFKTIKVPGSFSPNRPTATTQKEFSSTVHTPNINRNQMLQTTDVDVGSNNKFNINANADVDADVDVDVDVNETENGDVTLNANDVLSNFFKKKGNSQLTDVEYEGVMSLMSKSRAGTPYKRSNIELSMNEESEQASKRRHLTRGDESTIGLINGINDETFSIVGSTPHRQHYTRVNPNTSTNSIGYRSTYRPVYDDTFDRSYQLLHNNTISHLPRGRVTLMSRRPAPYRSRMKGFASRQSSLNRTSAETSTATANEMTKPDNSSFSESLLKKKPALVTASSSSSSSSFDKGRPMSQTARALLTILDGSKEKLTEAESKDGAKDQKNVKPTFSNPYAVNGRKSRQTRLPNAKETDANILEKSQAYASSSDVPIPKPDIFDESAKLKAKEEKEKETETETETKMKLNELSNSNAGAKTFSFGIDPSLVNKTSKGDEKSENTGNNKMTGDKKMPESILFSTNKAGSINDNSKPLFSFQPAPKEKSDIKGELLNTEKKSNESNTGGKPSLFGNPTSQQGLFNFNLTTASSNSNSNNNNSNNINSNNSIKDGDDTKENRTNNNGFNFSSKPAGGFSFGNASAQSPVPNGTSNLPTQTSFVSSFGSSNGSKTTPGFGNLSVPEQNTVNRRAEHVDEFIFPQPKVVEVQLNRAEVERLKPLFPF
ncbi:hypothetical protein LELG_04584 [Lodderomyces elongisporus NRRL YB-4239]|uniref:Nucleoporin NUP60 n=1 Tax=Lodderomyces elongisporus (strain ATCC 11503 / CBS 2605 / JCM 1781 / NBRC 1676 / NRRL YB-4239) TaxID=379508 RepID=A5E4P5_LODEL|nr:hypothetical protein LELG_04584 [Lodderomyces elongisporus NRRL YB-4239]